MPKAPPTHRPTRVGALHDGNAIRERRRNVEKSFIYNSEWRRLRSAFLAVNRICETPGCGRPATDADHIVSVRKRPDLRLDWSNLSARCHECHSRLTARFDGGFGHAARADKPGRAGRGPET
jgi:5-methylcytosine-specific restriction protein A